MAHDSCVHQRQFTFDEQKYISEWFINQMKICPFAVNLTNTTLKNKYVTYLIYVAGGPGTLQISDESGRQPTVFAPSLQQPLWDAIHAFRHEHGNEEVKALKAQMEAAERQVTARRLAEEARTEPEVAKLRELVNLKAGIVVAAVLAVCSVLGYVGLAFAG